MTSLLERARAAIADLPAGAPDRGSTLAHLDAHGAVGLTRGIPEHVTASALVLDATLRRALLVFHRKGGFWVQPGGHVDAGDADLLAAALRELREETGLVAWDVPTTRAADLDRHRLGDGFGRCAWHLDVGFVVLADPAHAVLVSDESTDVAWWDVDDLPTEIPPGLRSRLARAAAFVAHSAAGPVAGSGTGPTAWSAGAAHPQAHGLG